jgi:thiamine kinase-like enzyme
MKRMILDLALEYWNDCGLGPPPKELDCLLLNHVTANFVIFEKGAPQPRLLLKVTRNTSLSKEYKNLTVINQLCPDITPKPYGFHEVNGYFVLIEDFIVGKKIFRFRRRMQLIDQAFDALIKLHKTLRGEDFILDDAQFDKLLRSPVQEFNAQNTSTIFTSQCDRLLRILENYKNTLFPRIPQHGDFSFVNVLFERQGVKIIDWEDFGEIILPLYDVFTLINSLYFDLRLFSNYTNNNPINILFNRKIREYCNTFNIHPKLVSLLYPISLVIFYNKNNPDRIEAAQTTAELINHFFLNKDRFHLLYFE